MRMIGARGFLALGALVAAGYWWTGSSERSASERAAVAAAPPSSVSHALPASPSVGRGEYRFRRELWAALGGRPAVTLELAGRLWVEGEVLIASFDSPSSLKASPPVRIEFRKVGRPRVALGRSAGDPAVQDPEALARFALDIAEQYRFFSREDLQGEFQAEIRETSARTYVKRKQRYLSGPYERASIEKSEHSLRLDAQHRIEEVRGSERITLGDSALRLETVTSYRIEPARESLSVPAKEQWVAAAAEDPGRSVASGFALEGVPSLAELLARVRGGTLKSASERLSVFRGLVKRLDHEAGAAKVVRESLEQEREKADRYALLIGALAGSVNAEAQAGLVDEFRSPRVSAEAKGLILNAWTLADAPASPEAIGVLRELAGRGGASASAALLALGAQVNKLGDPAERKALEDELIARLQASRSDAERVAALDSIGNAATPRLFPFIRDFLSDASSRVRARAYLALRVIPGDDAARALDAGRTDPSLEVRESVERALELRSASG